MCRFEWRSHNPSELRACRVLSRNRSYLAPILSYGCYLRQWQRASPSWKMNGFISVLRLFSVGLSYLGPRFRHDISMASDTYSAVTKVAMRIWGLSRFNQLSRIVTQLHGVFECVSAVVPSFVQIRDGSHNFHCKVEILTFNNRSVNNPNDSPATVQEGTPTAA